MSNEASRTASTRATLSVTVKANEVIVAEEVVNQRVWQQVLTAITHPPAREEVSAMPNGPFADGVENGSLTQNDTAVTRLAQKLGLSESVLKAGCSPSKDQPYLTLDIHCWEQMKSQLPKTGAAGAAPIVTPATLLALWFREAGMGNPTQAQAQDVLQAIGLRDRNASRSIRNASWLQARAGGQVILNPAEVSKALAFAKCFCSKDWSAWKEMPQ